jgi:AP-4 complex subunit beta-1
VHDRALLYYRLLQQGADMAERVINPPKRAVNEFAETQSSEAKDRIFDEFNTLSVVYRQVRQLSVIAPVFRRWIFQGF